jgi:uncharacterized membrane protein
MGNGTEDEVEFTHAFIWDASGGIRDLGYATNSSYGSHAFGINNAGMVVGAAGDGPNDEPDLLPTACLWDISLTSQFLGVIEGYSFQSYGYDINSSGQVAGTSEAFGSDAARGFLWDNISGLQELLPPPGWPSSCARAINDVG